jgi:hypothetical protein
MNGHYKLTEGFYQILPIRSVDIAITRHIFTGQIVHALFRAIIQDFTLYVNYCGYI